METLLREKKVVVVTEKDGKFGMLELGDSTYALEILRSIAKEFNKESGGYKLLVSSMFRTPEQQRKLSKKSSVAIKGKDGQSTHEFGNTFDFTITRFRAPNGEEVKNKPSLVKILDAILIKYQRCGRAMGYFENAARHVIAAKP